MLVIAHRGASIEAPENTMAAFERAVALGADMIELDVRRTRDGELVVFHDDSLARIVGVPGTVEGSTLAQVVHMGIPRLADVLALGIPLDIELKASSDTDPQTVIDRLEPLVRGRSDLLVSSFDLALLSAARRLPLPVCRIYDEGDFHEDFGPWAILHGRLATAERVAAIHAAGSKVLVWTLDRAEQWEQARAVGVDGICTNDPAALLRWSGL